MVEEVSASRGEDGVEIPNWLKWVAVIGLIIWLITDPAGMADVATQIWDGLMTFFKGLG